jgi:regulator of sigma E protease
MWIVGFLLVLGPLVTLHELGHYIAGRVFGVKADAFSVGFGKEIAGFTDKRGTRWKLSALPLGGYVQFAGDMNAASVPDTAAQDKLTAAERAQTFQAKPLYQRALIVFAGPLTNLIVAVTIFAAFNMAYGRVVAEPVVSGFTQGSPAAAGLKAGDRILAVNGDRIDSFDELRENVLPYPGRDVRLRIEREGREFDAKVHIATHVERDRFGNESRIGLIGISSQKLRLVKLGPVEAVAYGCEQSWGMVKMMVTGIVQIFTGERSVKELGGPIKIAKYSGEQFSLGWAQYGWFVALISINLAFINLLPIPALDGGHLAMYAAEAVRRKPLGARSQEWAFRTGMALVLALMLFVTVNDLLTLPWFG